jgi:hypothetical protein
MEDLMPPEILFGNKEEGCCRKWKREKEKSGK